MSNYVKIWRPAVEYQDLMGVSRKTVNRRCQNDWQIGVHYNYDGRQLLLNFKEIDKYHGQIRETS